MPIQEEENTKLSQPYARIGDFIIEPKLNMLTILNLSEKTSFLKDNIDTFVSSENYGIIQLENPETKRNIPNILKGIAHSLYHYMMEDEIQPELELIYFANFVNFFRIMLVQMTKIPPKKPALTQEECDKFLAFLPEVKRDKNDAVGKMIEFLSLGIDIESALAKSKVS